MFTDEEKQKVRDATDLAALVGETVVLRPRGADLWGCCPFHHEKSPSFHVIPSRGLWKCFGCGKGGDCFAYVQEREHLEFPDAVRFLADRAGITLSDERYEGRRGGSRSKKQRLYEAMEAAAQFYHLQLTRVRSEGADAARSYLGGRGFGSAVAQRWDLGYAPGSGTMVRELTSRGFTRQELIDAKLAVVRDGSARDAFYNRVMFPIRDERGRVVALGGRVMDQSKPKYINSAESPIYSKSHTMFALDRAKSHITARMEAIVEEGYTDVIATHEAGIENAVAPLGTALTANHVKMLSRFLTASGDKVSRGRIVCLFDGDEAGVRAAERALGFVSLTSATFYCVVLPGGQDPAEFLEHEGADALRALLADPVPLARFVVDRHLARFDITTPEGRASALADCVQAMAPLKGTALADDYIAYVAGRLMVDASTVRGAFANVRWTPPSDDDAPSTFGGRAGTLDYDDAPLDRFDEGFARDSAAYDTAPPQAPLLPDDARMVHVEREVLSTIAGDVGAALGYADRVARLLWADPRHEAIAWALLSLPAGSTPLEALGAAEAVVPEAAEILADGTAGLAGEGEGMGSEQRLQIMLDDLEARSLRRRIDAGRAQLRTMSAAADPEAFNSLFSELSGLQRNLRELESRMRMIK